jgi:hypothetical protein
MTDDRIVLKRSEVEALRRHLQQECESSGTIEGGAIAADALNRVEDLLADAPAVVDAGVCHSHYVADMLYVTVRAPEHAPYRALLIEEKNE